MQHGAALLWQTWVADCAVIDEAFARSIMSRKVSALESRLSCAQVLLYGSMSSINTIFNSAANASSSCLSCSAPPIREGVTSPQQFWNPGDATIDADGFVKVPVAFLQRYFELESQFWHQSTQASATSTV